MRPAPQTGAPGTLWIFVGVMTAIELILTLSSSGFFRSQNLRWPAFVLGAFWQPLLSGMAQPVYLGQSALMFITHAFLHGGIAHLAMNGVILFPWEARLVQYWRSQNIAGAVSSDHRRRGMFRAAVLRAPRR